MRLSPEGRAFVEATRGLDEPTDRDRRRIRAKTLAALASAGPGTARYDGGHPHTPGAGSTLGHGGASLGWTGGALKGALLALAVLGGQAVFDRARRPPGPGGLAGEPSTNVEPVQDRHEERAAPPAPAGPATLPRPPGERGGAPSDGARAASTASRPAPEARPTAASPPPPARQSPATNAMDDELAALREAQEALRADRPDEAVRVLDRFAATHASVVLEEERRAARIVAVCKAGGGAQARADAERFLRERPDAPLGERIRLVCLQKAPP